MMEGIARNTATNNESLNGVVKGDITVVAISCVPFGSFSFRGVATKEKIWFEQKMHGRKTNATVTIERMSRSSRSSKCEISVPSTSFSGSSLMGRSIRRIGGRLSWLVGRGHPTDPVLLLAGL